MEDRATARYALFPAARQEIADAYFAALKDAGSPLLVNVGIEQQMRRQLEAVLDEVQDGGRPLDRTEIDAPSAALNAEIGADRATVQVRPAESLIAAGHIFQTALPVVTREWAAAGVADPATAAALALNRVLASRMSEAADAYVEFLLERVQKAQSEERRRIARELHDRAAHAVGVGVQRLELLRWEKGASAGGQAADSAGDEGLGRLRETLLDAVNTIRSLCAELRDPFGSQNLEQTLREYIEANRPAGMAVRLSVTDPADVLPRAHAQEFYMAVREAVRNAMIHSGSEELWVCLSVEAGVLCAEVTDRGRGYDTTAVRRGRDQVGLQSMRERLELLGGVVAVTSSPSVGTQVSMRVPVPGKHR